MTTDSTSSTVTTAAEATPAFVHLRNHSEYSVLDGITRIPDMVHKAVQSEQPALAPTALANLVGLIKFDQARPTAGVQPIVRADIWLESPADRDRPHRALFLADNYDGYLAVCRVLREAGVENQYRGRG